MPKGKRSGLRLSKPRKKKTKPKGLTISNTKIKGIHYTDKDTPTTIAQKHGDRAARESGIDPKSTSAPSIFTKKGRQASANFDKAFRAAAKAAKGHKKMMKGLSLLKGK